MHALIFQFREAWQFVMAQLAAALVRPMAPTCGNGRLVTCGLFVRAKAAASCRTPNLPYCVTTTVRPPVWAVMPIATYSTSTCPSFHIRWISCAFDHDGVAAIQDGRFVATWIRAVPASMMKTSCMSSW